MATKKVDPYTLSAMVNEVSMYSPAWRIVKYPPKATVRVRAAMASLRVPLINAW